MGGQGRPELEDKVSQQLICPISHLIMDCPMISPSGHTYDRDSIVSWLSRRPVDPLSLAPLTVDALYPNRALHNEIAMVLQGVVSHASATGDTRLLKAANAKLNAVIAAQASPPPRVPWLERVISKCAFWATWWGLLAKEEFIMFLTSYGAVLCLSVDCAAVLRKLGKTPNLVSAFTKVVLIPTAPLPKHWRTIDRLTVFALRGALLLPWAIFIPCWMMGTVLSAFRFARRVKDMLNEGEQIQRTHWFGHSLLAFTGITGFASIGLWTRLYRDYKSRRGW